MRSKKRMGLACLSPEKRREIASKGGKASQEAGTAHKWVSGEKAAQDAGRKGGLASAESRAKKKTAETLTATE